ncbi:MAG: hypothetical protein IPL94_13250 [Tetrasphaera sp.]|nr:hypothetical protein [Tetrasphaera sp.]
MGADLLLLPSPLLPATAYSGLADALRGLGRDVIVAPANLAHGEGATDLVARWSALAEPGLLVVAHSNAGLSAPTVRSCSEGSRLVFMDAALPPESGSTALAPEGFQAHLATLADEHGVLPPWTRWWSRDDLEGVIPEDRFDELDRTCPRLPLRYFHGRLTPPPDWATSPSAYLAFGDTYATEIEFARARGWPVMVLAGGHMHFLHEPATVAQRVLDLEAAMAVDELQR